MERKDLFFDVGVVDVSLVRRHSGGLLHFFMFLTTYLT